MLATASSPTVPAAPAPVDFEDTLPLLRLPVLLLPLVLVVAVADPALPLLFLAFLLSEAVLTLAGAVAGGPD
jgi:hypothetical protein